MDQANEKDVGVSSSIKIRKPLLVKSKVFSLLCPYFYNIRTMYFMGSWQVDIWFSHFPECVLQEKKYIRACVTTLTFDE